MVVGIQQVGNTPKPTKRLEPCDDPRLERVARLLDLARLHGAGSQGLELRVDRLLELLGRMAGARRCTNPELRPEDQRLLEGGDVLCDLLLVDKLLIEAARATATEDIGEDF